MASKHASAVAPVLRDALINTPRERWGDSNEVAAAFLNCPRVKGILKHLGHKFRLPQSSYADIMQNTWIVLVPKIQILDQESNIYSYLYKFIENTIRSELASNSKTEHLRDEEEENSEEQHINPLGYTDNVINDHAENVIASLDTERARAAFSKKLAKYAWPTDIIRDPKSYGRIGRPRKEDIEIK